MKRTVTTLLGFTVVGLSGVSLPVAAQQSAIPGAPSHLTVEYRATPIGIDDPTPEFSWLPHDARRNSIQSA